MVPAQHLIMCGERFLFSAIQEEAIKNTAWDLEVAGAQQQI